MKKIIRSCPSCGETCLSIKSLFFSSTYFPTNCSSCGCLVTTNSRDDTVISILNSFLIMVGVLLVIFFQSYWAVLLLISYWSFTKVYSSYEYELIEVEAETLTANRILALLVFLAIASVTIYALYVLSN